MAEFGRGVFGGCDFGVGGRTLRIGLKMRRCDHAALVLVIGVRVGMVQRGVEGHVAGDCSGLWATKDRVVRACAVAAAGAEAGSWALLIERWLRVWGGYTTNACGHAFRAGATS